MIRYFNPHVLYMLMLLAFTSCATIIGGNKYRANISVIGAPDAKIMYEGMPVGQGYATVSVKRRNANRFSFSVKQRDCDEKVYYFNSRRFRTAAFIGSILGWTGILPNGLLLPWGAAVDIISGSLWKPDEYERGVSKIDFRTYNYRVEYDGCPVEVEERQTQPINISAGPAYDVVKLFDGRILKGEIFEKVPNQYLKIKTLDNNIHTLPMDNVLEISKEAAAPR